MIVGLGLAYAEMFQLINRNFCGKIILAYSYKQCKAGIENKLKVHKESATKVYQ